MPYVRTGCHDQINRLRLASNRRLRLFYFLPQVVRLFIAILPFSARQLFKDRQTFGFRFRPAFYVSAPTIGRLSFQQGRRGVKGSSSAVANVRSIILFRVIPVVPNRSVQFEDLFPSLPILGTRTSRLRTILMRLASFLRLQLQRSAEAASPTPRIRRSMFPTGLDRTIGLSFRIMRVHVNDFLTCFRCDQQVRNRMRTLPFGDLFLYNVRAIMRLLRIFLVQVIFARLRQRPRPVRFVRPSNVSQQLFRGYSDVLHGLVTRLVHRLLRAICLYADLFLISSLYDQPRRLGLLRKRPLGLFPFLTKDLRRLLLRLLFLSVALCFPEMGVQVFSLCRRAASKVRPRTRQRK